MPYTKQPRWVDEYMQRRNISDMANFNMNEISLFDYDSLNDIVDACYADNTMYDVSRRVEDLTNNYSCHFHHYECTPLRQLSRYRQYQEKRLPFDISLYEYQRNSSFYDVCENSMY